MTRNSHVYSNHCAVIGDMACVCSCIQPDSVEPSSGIAAGTNRASKYDYVLFLIIPHCGPAPCGTIFGVSRGGNENGDWTDSSRRCRRRRSITVSDRTAPGDGRRIHSINRRGADHSHYRLQLLTNQFENTFDAGGAAHCQTPKYGPADESCSRAKR